MKKKSELEGNLFDKAMEWYQSGDRGKREAALELFPEDLLESEIENYKKRNKKERQKTREEELNNVLAKCKKMFPIGSIIWSDEGTDNCPNIVVGEPFIGNTKWSGHIPYGKYECSVDDEEKKTVLVKTLRIFRDEITEESYKWAKSTVGLEKLLINQAKPIDQRYPRRDLFVDLDKYKNERKMERESQIERLKDKIKRYHEDMDELQNQLDAWEAYDPYGLTKEKIQQLIDKWKW